MTQLATRTRSEWERLATPLRPEGRAFINGRLVAARDGRVFFPKYCPPDGQCFLVAIARGRIVTERIEDGPKLVQNFRHQWVGGAAMLAPQRQRLLVMPASAGVIAPLLGFCSQRDQRAGASPLTSHLPASPSRLRGGTPLARLTIHLVNHGSEHIVLASIVETQHER